LVYTRLHSRLPVVILPLTISEAPSSPYYRVSSMATSITTFSITTRNITMV
jgi:hypothetical protein